MSSSWDGELRLWDLSTGETARHFVGHTKDVFFIALSVDNRQIISASLDKIQVDPHRSRHLHRSSHHRPFLSYPTVAAVLDSSAVEQSRPPSLIPISAAGRILCQISRLMSIFCSSGDIKIARSYRLGAELVSYIKNSDNLRRAAAV